MNASKKSGARQLLGCAVGALLLAAWLPGATAQRSRSRISRPQATRHANGEKQMLIVRIAAKDKPGKPIPEAEIRATMKEFNEFLASNSGGKLSFVVTVPPVVQVASLYNAKEIMEAIEAAGFEIAKYDLVIWIGDDGKGGGLWGDSKFRQQSFLVWGFDGSDSVIYWMPQALYSGRPNGWESSTENPIGAGEPALESNHFDATVIRQGHYGTRAKNYVGWLPDSDVQTITQSGTYRVAAHDQPNAAGTRVLKIAKDGDKNYWIEFRQGFPENPWAMNGALVMWNYNASAETQLLDMSPNSIGHVEFHMLGFSNGRWDIVDAPLVIGRTFSDREANIHITPLRKVTVNGLDGKPLKALEIAVNMGQFPDNRPPRLSIKASAQSVKAEQKITFEATSDDPDGDAISYYWDFGDYGFNGGNAVTSYEWKKTREYVVRCTASDMRGGTASASLVVKVGAPQTTRIAGRVLVDGKPLADAVVALVPEMSEPEAKTQAEEDIEAEAGHAVNEPPINRVFTDSDGVYTLVNLEPKSVWIEASKDGYKIAPAGSSTHVGPIAFVASKTAQLDFDAVRVPIVIPPDTAPSDAKKTRCASDRNCCA